MQNKNLRRTLFPLIAIVVAAIFMRYSDDINLNNQTAGASTLTRLHFIDVGQGDCEFIESNGEYMLIDAGEAENAEKIKAYLKEHGVEKLKYVIATHPHADHIGAMGNVIQDFNVDAVIMPNVVSTNRAFERLVNTIEQNNINLLEPTVGDTYEFGDCTFTIISPFEYNERNLNNSSVGIRLVHNNDKVIMLGDAEKSVENQILNSGIDISADLYKAGHHGSSSSSSEKFINAVNPKYAVISCGKNNMYGHPHMETLALFKSLGIQYYRTDESGDIVFTSTGNGLKLDKGVMSGTNIG